MPYLHWETSRQRELFATEIEKIITRAKIRAAENEKREKKGRQAERKGISKKLNDNDEHRAPCISWFSK